MEKFRKESIFGHKKWFSSVLSGKSRISFLLRHTAFHLVVLILLFNLTTLTNNPKFYLTTDTSTLNSSEINNMA